MQFRWTSMARFGLTAIALLTLGTPFVAALDGGIAGSVTGPDGVPLPGLEVSAFFDAGAGWQVAAWTSTASDGSYQLAPLADGTYRLLFLDRDQVWAYEYHGEAAVIGDAADVVVDGTVVTVDAILDEGGHIQGRLTDPSGVPLEYPLVFVHTFEDDPQLLFLATPDGNGDYDVGGLPTGGFIIQFTGRRGLDGYSGYWDGKAWIGDADPVPVIVGEITSGIDGELGPPAGGYTGGIEGLVTGPGGVPLPEIEVSLYRRQGVDWVGIDWQNTAAVGSYAFDELEDGSYTLLFRDWSQGFAFSYYGGASRLEDAVTVEIVGAVITIDASLELAGHITGTLTDPGGRPLDYPMVFVHTAELEPELLFLTTPDPSTGAYDIGGLPTGDYLIQFTGRQGLNSYVSYYDGVELISDATPIPVIVGETTSGIDGELGAPPGGVIEGEITNPYGRAFDFARVGAYAWNGSDWVLAGSADTLYYEPEYRLPLAPGSYRLRIAAGSFLQPDLPAVEYFDNVLDIADGTDVTVELDQTIAGFDVIVGDLSTGSISGTVTDVDTGAPVAGIEVYPADRRGRVLWDQVAVTDSDGSYTVAGLWPEGYLIEFYDPLFGYETLRLPDHVLVAEGAVTGVDGAIAVAAPGSLPGSISGTVTSPTGEPVVNARVTASSTSDADFGFALTNSQGRFRIRNLSTDEYWVGFSSIDGFRVPEWYDDATARDQATPVMVVDGSDTGGIDAELAPAGVITGTITDRFGNDFFISTATAYVFDAGGWQEVASTSNAYEFDYRLEGVPVGVVRVRLAGRTLNGPTLTEFFDDVATIELGTDVPIVFGEITTDIDASLGSGPPGTISGQVTDGAGTGLGGIEVQVYDDEFGLEEQSVSASDGSYEVSGLYNGRYSVEFVDPSGSYPSEVYDDVASLNLGTPVFVEDGGTTSGIDAALDGPGGGPGGGGMRGVVTDAQSGVPIEGIRVRCIAEDFSYVDGCSTSTAADGSYQLAGFLPAGNYYVSFRSSDGFWADEWYNDVLRVQQATPVAVTLGSWTDGIEAALEPAGGISGTVTNEGGGSFPLLTVTAFAWNGNGWELYKSFITAYESDYELTGLPEGVYRIRFRGGPISNPGGGIVEFYDDVATLEDGTDVPVAVGQLTQGIDAMLGNIDGTHESLIDTFETGGLELWSAVVGDP